MSADNFKKASRDEEQQQAAERKDPIVLTDYSLIKNPEWEDFCMKLQGAISDDGNNECKCDILSFLPDAENDDEDDEDPKRPTVFGLFNGKYYTKKYAGVLTYRDEEENEKRTVIIHSRFDGEDDRNFFLTYALTKAEMIPPKGFSRMDRGAQPEDIFRILLARVFAEQVRDAYNYGVYREYQTFEYNDSRPKGRLDISRHIRLNPLQNGKVAYSTREYTANNPINHLILAAYRCLLADEAIGAGVEGMLSKGSDLGRPFAELEMQLGREELSRANVGRLLNKTLRPISHPMHRRYEDVRRTAAMVLRHSGLNPFQEEQNQVGGILIPMDKLWELFLEHAVFKKIDASNVKTQVTIPVILDENGKGKRTFRPDFLFGTKLENGGVAATAVLDGKYRKAWGDTYQNETGNWGAEVRNDVFQVMSYMYVTGAKKGGIVFPLPETEVKEREPSQICKRLNDSFFDMIPMVIADSENYKGFKEYKEKMDQYCDDCAKRIQKFLPSEE